MNSTHTKTDKTPSVNVSRHLKEAARCQPYKRAVVHSAGRDRNGRIAYAHLTFLQLDRESDRLAHGLKTYGITRGARTLLMVRPGLEFFAIVFAVFKLGAVPVLVDPGMGIRRMLRCLQSSNPEAMIGIPAAHLLRTIYPKYFTSVKRFVTVGRRWFWGGKTLKQIRPDAFTPFPPAETNPDDTAAVLFTTGSTGPAKGVVYTHGIFNTQIHQIKSHFQIGPEEIDLPTFPLFALFDPALGMTAVIPDMDPTKPALVDPEKIIEAITNHGVTNMFASPALLNRVGRYGQKKGLLLPSLRRVVSAGAPVSPANIEQFSAMCDKAVEIHTPYGATEAMPVLSIAGSEILNETRSQSEKGYGMCVGRPLDGIDVRLVRIDDGPMRKWSDDAVVPDGEIGEIVVRGDLVTKHYFQNPDADALAKIPQGDTVWHRMGDLGWRDKKGRIWFCGRKSHRVVTEKGTLYTIPCEAIFNNHPNVFRSALVGIGPLPKKKPVICIEPKEKLSRKEKAVIKKELLEMAGANALTKEIDTLLFHTGFPVDIRHNAKIFREKLAEWAAEKLEKKLPGVKQSA